MNSADHYLFKRQIGPAFKQLAYARHHVLGNGNDVTGADDRLLAVRLDGERRDGERRFHIFGNALIELTGKIYGAVGRHVDLRPTEL